MIGQDMTQSQALMANKLEFGQDRDLLTIYDVSKILSSSLNLPRTLREVLNVLVHYLGIRRGMVSVLQPSGELRLVAAYGLSKEEFRRGRFEPGEGITGKILQSGMPVVLHNIADEPLYLNRTGSLEGTENQPVSFVGVPIKIGTQVVGVLSLDHLADTYSGSFQKKVMLLSMVANLIGQAIRLQQGVVAEREALVQEQRRLKTELQGKYSLDNVVGYSKGMQEVFAQVHQAAPGRATILLRGESGTGKEVIAKAIHYLSPRKAGPFIKLNCAALSETLLESELFGHEKGAFTGAQNERKGRFEMAHGGTLFLDEIGDISPEFQTKLLRVLQEREFERVGGNRSIRVDVRLITATNRDLEKAIMTGDFRADLYYRINVVGIFLPPLRERREDIPYLIELFLKRFNGENQRDMKISPEAIRVMLNCYWPGNVRELENCVERTATMTRNNVIQEVDFLCQHDRCLSQVLHGEVESVAVSMPVSHRDNEAEMPVSLPLGRENEPVNPPTTERERLIWALEQCGWVQAKAARLLNISARQMGYALLKFNIEVRKF
jgi:Nif-specific regulatory protein